MEKCIVAVCIAGLLAIVVCAMFGTQLQEDFKKEHNCKILTRYPGSLHYGIDSKVGVVMILSPAKSDWICDNGVVYTW
jgi:hypothetical protein